MTTRELFTIFGQHALAYYADANAIYRPSSHLEVVVDPQYDASGNWTGIPVFVADMEEESGFSFYSDATGRWWIIFANSASAISRSYSDDCGDHWTTTVTAH